MPWDAVSFVGNVGNVGHSMETCWNSIPEWVDTRREIVDIHIKKGGIGETGGRKIGGVAGTVDILLRK